MVTETADFSIKIEGMYLPEKTHLPNGRELGAVLAELEKRVARLEPQKNEKPLPGGKLTANDWG